MTSGPARRLVLLVAVSLLAVACGRPAPAAAWEPLSIWIRPLCFAGVTPVDAPAGARFYRVYERLLVVVQPDIDPQFSVGAIIVQVPPDALLPPKAPEAWTCVRKGPGPLFATVVILAHVVTRLEKDEDPDAALARVLAHELAHVAGHASEDAAEVMGAYYAERAGFDCRRWVTGFGPYWIPSAERRALLQEACAMAKKGLRPVERDALKK